MFRANRGIPGSGTQFLVSRKLFGLLVFLGIAALVSELQHGNRSLASLKVPETLVCVENVLASHFRLEMVLMMLFCPETVLVYFEIVLEHFLRLEKTGLETAISF